MINHASRSRILESFSKVTQSSLRVALGESIRVRDRSGKY